MDYIACFCLLQVRCHEASERTSSGNASAGVTLGNSVEAAKPEKELSNSLRVIHVMQFMVGPRFHTRVVNKGL